MAFHGPLRYTARMPEKSFQEIPRAWREQYEKGRAAFERNNLDYAISILAKVIEQEPGFFECRQALRASQFKKAGVGGTTFFRKLIGSTSPKLLQARAHLRGNPLESLQLAEQVLNNDPNNLDAHKVLAEAALAADLPRTAVLSLEIVYKQAPRDRDLVLKLAGALARIGQAARAEHLLGELVKAHPHDPEVTQALKDASANRTLKEGGYDALATGQGSYRDILRDEQEAVTLEQEKRDHRTEDVTDRLLAEYETRLAQEPQNLRLLRSIADLHAEKKDYDRALEYYQRLAGAETADPTLERTIADLRVRKYDQALAQLDPGDPAAAEAIGRLKTEKRDFLVEDCRRRLERYPNDLQVRFELGQLYFEAGRLSDAIQEFQKAQNHPNKRLAALYHLGQCFARRGMHDLAVRTFQNALREKSAFDDEKKDLIYALGCSLERMGRREEAIEQLKLIYEVDITFRDVSAKVDAYYAGQAGG